MLQENAITKSFTEHKVRRHHGTAYVRDQANESSLVWHSVKCWYTTAAAVHYSIDSKPFIHWYSWEMKWWKKHAAKSGSLWYIKQNMSKENFNKKTHQKKANKIEKQRNKWKATETALAAANEKKTTTTKMFGRLNWSLLQHQGLLALISPIVSLVAIVRRSYRFSLGFDSYSVFSTGLLISAAAVVVVVVFLACLYFISLFRYSHTNRHLTS